MPLEAAQFKNPGAAFTEAPLWTWNDKLDDNELLRQLDALEAGGWRGFFIHPRPGLITPYLSPEWMAKVRLVVEHAARKGMQAWIYDENVCPSGYADGIVSGQDPSLRMQGLAMRLWSRPDDIHGAVATFSCRIAQGQMTDVVRHDAARCAEPDQSYLQFIPYRAPIGTLMHGGISTVDVLNPRAADAFIASTYAPYADALGEWLGSTMPGFFTDEPSYSIGCAPALPVVPWTERFPDEFARTNGYDIRDALPSLFFDVGDYARVRFDYWNTLCELFVQSFTKRIYDWCDARGLSFTGHFMAEDTLLSQILHVGACMRHYEYEHLPGLDHLGMTHARQRDTARGIATLLTVKQTSSVAGQLGRPRVFCEAYGCSGENMSFEDRKWIGDWLAVLGVNFFDPHLSLYSLRGPRKRDCPPVLFFQQPWWGHNRLIGDYFTRLSYAMSAGQPVAQVLVLHPIGSAWAAYTPQNTRQCERLDAQLEWVMHTLLQAHHDYDLGDESLLRKHGRVDGKTLVVGEARYRTVVIPPSITWTRETVALLQQFVDAGGAVIAVEPLPTLLHGEPDQALDALLTRARIISAGDEPAFVAVLARMPADVDISGPDTGALWYRLRRDDQRQILFLVNTKRDQAVRATISLAGSGALEEWNLFTGDTAPSPAEAAHGRMVFDVEMPPVGSRLFVLDESRAAVAVPDQHVPAFTREMRLGESWQLTRDDPNVLNLDVCTYRLDDDDWSEPTLLIHAGKAIAAAGPGAPFAIRIACHSALATHIDRGIRLVVDASDGLRLSVNGQAVILSDDAWWIDPSFKTVEIGALLHPGENILEMHGTVGLEVATPFWETNPGIQMDICYIIGHFGVRSADGLHFELTEAPRDVIAGDLGPQGYPFYAGAVRLAQQVTIDGIPESAVLELERLHATLASVTVNGRPAGTIFLRPHRVEVTGLLQSGANTLEITLVGTLRNLIGPLHDPDGESGWVFPARFFEGGDRPRAYSLAPFGFEAARLLVSG